MINGNRRKQIHLHIRTSSHLFIFLLVFLLPNVTGAYELLMGTGKEGSFSYFAGRTLCRIISMDPELECRAISAPNATHNLTNLRSGALDMALIDSRMLHDAYIRQGFFKYMDISYDNLKPLVSMYVVPIVLIARDDSGIASLDDVRGKRFNAGPPLSLNRLAAETILEAKGWSRKSFRLMEELPQTQAQDRIAFSKGTVQAMLDIGVHPNPSLRNFLNRANAKMVSMDDEDINRLIEEHHAYSKITLPAETYMENSAAVATFGTQAILTSSEDLDADTVQTILTLLFENRDRLKKAHPALSFLKNEKTRKLNGEIRPHQGAINFFQAREP